MRPGEDTGTAMATAMSLAMAMGKRELESGCLHQDRGQEVNDQVLEKRRRRNQGHVQSPASEPGCMVSPASGNAGLEAGVRR